MPRAPVLIAVLVSAFVIGALGAPARVPTWDRLAASGPCETNGVDVAYGTSYRQDPPPDAYRVHDVVVSQVSGSCKGESIEVVLLGAADQELASGIVAISGPSTTVPMTPAPRAEDVTRVHVSIQTISPTPSTTPSAAPSQPGDGGGGGAGGGGGGGGGAGGGGGGGGGGPTEPSATPTPAVTEEPTPTTSPSASPSVPAPSCTARVGGPRPDGVAGAIIVGSDDADVLLGTVGADIICAFGGDDLVSAADGPDRLLGGGGDDTLRGGVDGDDIRGRMGDDVLHGGRGGDLIA
ncbi:MAG: hypothetical protein M3161_03475, partial [Actinomycetota bacterium]|nr:hypothetical protein [Actinomycetota bacterium]